MEEKNRRQSDFQWRDKFASLSTGVENKLVQKISAEESWVRFPVGSNTSILGWAVVVVSVLTFYCDNLSSNPFDG